MRKGINGLSALVEIGFKLDPFSNALFVFCNSTRTRLKILEWDGDGFWMHLKRLERGRFKWPEALADEKLMTLNERELTHLLGGPGLEQKLRRKQVEEKMKL
jgi:transposase